MSLRDGFLMHPEKTPKDSPSHKTLTFVSSDQVCAETLGPLKSFLYSRKSMLLVKESEGAPKQMASGDPRREDLPWNISKHRV